MKRLNNKILKLFLIFLIGILCNVQVTYAKVTSKDLHMAYEEYYDFFKDKVDEDGYKLYFAVVDIDGDKVPEFLLKKKSNLTGISNIYFYRSDVKSGSYHIDKLGFGTYDRIMYFGNGIIKCENTKATAKKNYKNLDGKNFKMIEYYKVGTEKLSLKLMYRYSKDIGAVYTRYKKGETLALNKSKYNNKVKDLTGGYSEKEVTFMSFTRKKLKSTLNI